MPDSILAALIAGTATLSASFLQLRSALLREGTTRTAGASTRRKSRLQLIILIVIVGTAAASGFALSQWLTEGERAAQGVMQRELQARVAELGRATNQLELTRSSERADIETGVWRRIGADGVVATATVPACRPAALTSLGAGAAPGTRACTEAEATAVTLCATIPENASVTEVALFSRAANSDAPWSASRSLPGQVSEESRFAEKYSEGAPESGMRQVCQGFAHWSADHARVVRVVVRYSLPT